MATSAFTMLTTMMPGRGGEPHAQTGQAALPIVAPRPRNSGAKPRYESSQPERATHCRIQITKPDITTVKAVAAAEDAALEDVVAAGAGQRRREPDIGQGDGDLDQHRQEDAPDQLAAGEPPGAHR